MSGENGKKYPQLPTPLVPNIWKPGLSGNPRGGSKKSRLRAELEKGFAQLIPITNPDGTSEAIPFAEYAARYLLKWGFPTKPDAKFLAWYSTCLKAVMDRVDPVTADRLSPVVQVVVHSQRQEEFWNEVIDSAGERRVTPADVVEQLRTNGKQQK